jgi:hypothetical protein
MRDTQLDGEFRLVRSARAVMGDRMSAGVAQKADRCQIIITTERQFLDPEEGATFRVAEFLDRYRVPLQS